MTKDIFFLVTHLLLLLIGVAFYLLSLFCLPLPPWHVGREAGGGGGREERRGGDAGREGRWGGLAQRRCPVSLFRLQQTQEWLREKRTGQRLISTCLSSSVSVSISPSSSSSPPAFKHVSVRLADTRGRTLWWVMVLHGPGRCCAAASWHLFIYVPVQQWRKWFLLTCSQ